MGTVSIELREFRAQLEVAQTHRFVISTKAWKSKGPLPNSNSSSCAGVNPSVLKQHGMSFTRYLIEKKSYSEDKSKIKLN